MSQPVPARRRQATAGGTSPSIDREQYQALAEAYKARSAVAHGFKPPSELGPAVQALLGLAEAIARESRKTQIRKEEMDGAEEFFQGEVEWPEY